LSIKCRVNQLINNVPLGFLRVLWRQPVS
jgi:hypothetical protein